MQNSKVYYNYEGDTPLTAALLNVKYMISKEQFADNSLYRLIDTEGDLYLYENNYTLPFGFFVSTEENGRSEEEILALDKLFGNVNELEEVIKEETEEEIAEEALTPLTLQNRLVTALSVNSTLFESTNAEHTEDNAVVITVEKSGYVYAYTDSSKIKVVTATTNYNEEETLEFKKLNNEYIMDLGYHNAGDIITLETADEGSLYVSAYILNETVLAECLDTLSEQSMTLDSYDSNHIKGHIDAKGSGELVLSVPFEPGWTLKVDGVVTEMNIFEDCFISIPLTDGEHTIELSYYPSGLNAGIVISLISLAAFLLTIWLNKKKAATKSA